MGLGAATKDKVRQQVEFYFSESNLPRDAFLRGKTEENPDGYVDLALICTFTRMAQLLKLKGRDSAAKVPDETVEAVAEALAPSEVLLLSDNRRRVRRAAPLDAPAEEVARATDERSLYAAPFPFDTTLDALQEFFKQQGDVKSVRMRRHLTSKDFKGSVFVEFASKEQAEAVCARALEFEGAPVKMESKQAYLERKKEERHSKPNSPHNAAVAAAKPAKGKPAKKAAAKPAKGKPAKKAAAESEELAEGEGGEGGEGEAAEEEAGGGEEGGEEGGGEEEEPEVPDYDPGCVVHFSFGEEQEFVAAPTFHLVRDSFGGREGGVRYIDYVDGERAGYARFSTPEHAAAALALAGDDGSAMVAGYAAALRVLEGEEEEAYMTKAAAARAQHREDKAERPARRGGGRGGGRGRGRGGKRPFQGRGGGRGKRGRR